MDAHTIQTQEIENAKKDFEMRLKETFYAQNTESKMYFAAYDKDLISDDMLGVGEMAVSEISGGEKIIPLKTIEGKGIGEIIVTIKKERIEKKSIVLSNISLDLK